MKTITAAELDEKFDNGEDISEYLDWDNAVRPNLELQPVDLDLPVWAIHDLDAEAGRHPAGADPELDFRTAGGGAAKPFMAACLGGFLWLYISHEHDLRNHL